MIRIGFDDFGSVYESYSVSEAKLVSSSTLFTPASIGNLDEDVKMPESARPSQVDWNGLFFREDTFDPVTRIRRGRLYKKPGKSHDTFWLSYKDKISKDLLVFESLHTADIKVPVNKLRVFLGVKEFKTEWLLLNIEPITTGEFVLTLKATSFFGIVPELDLDKMPQGHKNRILEKTNKLISDFNVATPTAIIDLARDAASEVMNSLILSMKLSATPQDLSESANIYSKHCSEKKLSQEYNVIHCAKILANLHVQNKSVSQLKSEFRSLGEADAEMAVRCLAQIFMDLSWSKQ